MCWYFLGKKDCCRFAQSLGRENHGSFLLWQAQHHWRDGFLCFPEDSRRQRGELRQWSLSDEVPGSAPSPQPGQSRGGQLGDSSSRRAGAADTSRSPAGRGASPPTDSGAPPPLLLEDRAGVFWLQVQRGLRGDLGGRDGAPASDLLLGGEGGREAASQERVETGADSGGGRDEKQPADRGEQAVPPVPGVQESRQWRPERDEEPAGFLHSPGPEGRPGGPAVLQQRPHRQGGLRRQAGGLAQSRQAGGARTAVGSARAGSVVGRHPAGQQESCYAFTHLTQHQSSPPPLLPITASLPLQSISFRVGSLSRKKAMWLVKRSEH